MGFIKKAANAYYAVKEAWQDAADFISPEPTLDQSIQQVKDGICNIVQTLKRSAIAGRIYTVIRSGPLYDSIKKMDKLATEHKELIFCILTLVALYQNNIAAAAGFALGVAMGSLGAKMGMARDPIRLISTKQGLTTYNYLSAASMYVLATWLSSFQQGLVAGNYLTSSLKKSAPLQMLHGLGLV